MIGKKIKQIEERALKLERKALEKATNTVNRLRPMKAVGIDISDRSIEVVEIMRRGIRYEINAGRVPLEPNIVRLGRIIDRDKLAERLALALNTATPKKIAPDKAIFAVPETQVFSHIFKADIRNADDLNETIDIEAETTIPINYDDQLFTYRMIEPPLGMEGMDERDILIMATSRSLIREWHDFFASCNIKAGMAEFETLACYRGVLKDQGTVCVVDIGAIITSYAILNKSNLYYSYSINHGSELLTQRIVDEFQSAGKTITFEEAEELKIAYGLADNGMQAVPAAPSAPEAAVGSDTMPVQAEVAPAEAAAAETANPGTATEAAETAVSEPSVGEETKQPAEADKPAEGDVAAVAAASAPSDEPAPGPLNEAAPAEAAVVEDAAASVQPEPILAAGGDTAKLVKSALSKAMAPIIDELKIALEAGLERSTQTVNYVIITGGGSALKGLVEYLDQQMNPSAREERHSYNTFIFTTGEPLHFSKTKNLDPRCIEALGLAIRGLDVDSLTAFDLDMTPENLAPRIDLRNDDSVNNMISGIQSRYQEAEAKRSKFVKQFRILKYVLMIGAVLMIGSVAMKLSRSSDKQAVKFTQTQTAKNQTDLKVPVVTDGTQSGAAAIQGVMIIERVDATSTYEAAIAQTQAAAAAKVPEGLVLWPHPLKTSSPSDNPQFPLTITWLAYSDRDVQAAIIDDVRIKVNGGKFVINSSYVQSIDFISGNVLMASVSANFSAIAGLGK